MSECVCVCVSWEGRGGSSNYPQWKYSWPLKTAIEDKKNIKEREAGCIS